MPEHAVRLFADGDFICLHSLRYELSEEPDRSGGPLLARSIPYSAKVKIIEFLFHNFQLLLFWSFLCWSLRSFFGLDFFLFLFGDFFRLLFKLWLERLDRFRLLKDRVVFLFEWFGRLLLLFLGRTFRLLRFLGFLFLARGLHLDLGFSPVPLLRCSSNLSLRPRYDPGGDRLGLFQGV